MGVFSGIEVTSEQMLGMVLGLRPCPDAGKGLKSAHQTIPTHIKQPLYTYLGDFFKPAWFYTELILWETRPAGWEIDINIFFHAVGLPVLLRMLGWAGIRCA